MSEERVRQIVRHFHENGLKQILTTGGTLAELLHLKPLPVIDRLDFAHVQVDPTTFVTAEYRHVSSDLILNVARRPFRQGGRRKSLLITLLIELQMQPDRLMMLRVLDYLVQVWKHQVRQYGQKHKSLASVKLQPVLPVVLHTGSYSWERLGSLMDLMDDAEDVRELTPSFQPIFLSLPDLDDAVLEREGGCLGQVLSLLKVREAKQEVFARRLAQTVTKLQELRGQERLRRLELLSYVEGLVYHVRKPGEVAALRQRIDTVLQDDETRLEVDMARKLMPDIHRDEGRVEGALAANKRTLLELLQLRFGVVPAALEQQIQTSQDAEQLTQWLRNFATARHLDDVGLGLPE
jgi:hypothetical protein